MDKIATMLGLLGRAFVFLGMLCGCITIWHLIIKHLILR